MLPSSALRRGEDMFTAGKSCHRMPRIATCSNRSERAATRKPRKKILPARSLLSACTNSPSSALMRSKNSDEVTRSQRVARSPDRGSRSRMILPGGCMQTGLAQASSRGLRAQHGERDVLRVVALTTLTLGSSTAPAAQGELGVPPVLQATVQPMKHFGLLPPTLLDGVLNRDALPVTFVRSPTRTATRSVASVSDDGEACNGHCGSGCQPLQLCWRIRSAAMSQSRFAGTDAVLMDLEVQHSELLQSRHRRQVDRLICLERVRQLCWTEKLDTVR